jgi:purine-binding chemotaxis protein CheW
MQDTNTFPAQARSAPQVQPPLAAQAPLTKTAVHHKYLAFSLGGECFATPVLQVREIVRLMPVTPTPQTPDYVTGVMNLRGRIITVVDMRIRLGTVIQDASDRTCIVVIQLDDDHKSTNFVGVIVDTVDEVLAIHPQDIQERLSLHTSRDADYVLGMTHVGGNVRTLMDMQLFLKNITAPLHLIQDDTAHATQGSTP